MASYSDSDTTGRRGALKIISAIGATCAFPYASDELYGQTTAEHRHDTAPPAPAPTKPSFFTEEDFRVVSRVADLIIPATDTPGAVGAGVPIYIDTVVGKNKTQQTLFAEGLHWLSEKKFMDLPEAGQLAILEPLCEASDAGDLKHRHVQFFHLMKNLTTDGYYTSQTGLMKELSYSGNTAMAEFPTCVHEH
jgi:gluconate 2-dehydrogenase gamma chain